MITPDPGFGSPTVLQAGGSPVRGGGNLLLLYAAGDEPGLLKVYRRRGSAWRERLKQISFRLIERKRGVSAKERWELERRNLELWRSLGLDVPALLPRPIPEAFASEPAHWLEYCPGPTLRDYIGDASVPLSTRRDALARGASKLAARQQLTLEMGERDLIMKHGSLTHILVFGSRQVSFDLEGGYAPTTPLLGALADELAGFVRSLVRGAVDGELQALGEAFAAGYGARDQLREIASYGASHRSLPRRIKRWNDRRRRGARAKASGLGWLLELAGE